MAAPANAPHHRTAEIECLLAGRPDEPDWLATLRREAAQRHAQLGLPTTRDEAWRFTNVASGAGAVINPGRPTPLDSAVVGPWHLDDSHQLVFVNGHLAPSLSNVGDLPDGVVVSTTTTMRATDLAWLEQWLGALSKHSHHTFAALNTALHCDAAVIRLDRGAAADAPIHLLFVSAGGGAPTASYPRTLIVADEASRATVVETHIGNGDCLSCPVTEIFLAAHAELDHYRVVDEAPRATHIGAQYTHQHRESTVRSTALTLGHGLARTDLDAALAGDGAHAELNGLTVLGGSEHADVSIRVHHTVPGCTSRQLYKAVLGGRSRSVFTGRIVVEPGAHKTNAEQSNRNLLLSEHALARSNPQLEILADDVRCTHGSTVGRLDEEAMFYLRSRGIARDQATAILTRAFAGEIVDGIRDDCLRSQIKHALNERLHHVGKVTL